MDNFHLSAQELKGLMQTLSLSEGELSCLLGLRTGQLFSEEGVLLEDLSGEQKATLRLFNAMCHAAQRWVDQGMLSSDWISSTSSGLVVEGKAPFDYMCEDHRVIDDLARFFSGY